MNRLRRNAVLIMPLAFGLLLPHGGAVAAPNPAPPAQQFLTRPDLRPPKFAIKTPAKPGTAPGQLFLAPRGGGVQSSLLIVDNNGELIWSGTRNPGSADFRVQRYQGKPVLTFWQGKPAGDGGHGNGTFYILDNTYHTLAKFNAGNGYDSDTHEFTITDRNTALITSYVPSRADLGGLGGPKDGWIMHGVFQEIDIATGKVLFEWHSRKHIPVADSYIPTRGRGTQQNPLDYFHINSVDKYAGDYLVSARHTHAVYRIDGKTGKVEWRLGGKRSNFAFGPNAKFNWQHDARFLDSNTISLFDNADDNLKAGPNRAPSRGVTLDLSTGSKKATLAAEYRNPAGLVATTQGSVQRLPGGNTLVGWGSRPQVTEFDNDGSVLFDATFGANSYRVYRSTWHAAPGQPPAVVARTGANNTMRVAVSWNGATEVRRWKVLAGPSRDDLSTVAEVGRDGFETVVDTPKAAFVQVRALNWLGQRIGVSPVVTVR